MSVHPDSQEYLVINMPHGLFQFKYLPFCLTQSPGLFQAFISKVLANVPGVLCYQDDILVMSSDTDSHNETLKIVVSKLKQAGLKLNVKKCKFFTNQVEYLGYIFDNKGVHPNPTKIFAIDSIDRHFISHEVVREHSERDRNFVLLMKYVKYGCPH